jgi:hypothetical protein
MTTNITEEKLVELGFRKVENSVKPTYYIHDDFPYHLIGFHINQGGAYQWGVYKDCGDCGELDLIISNLSDIISYVARKSLELGKRLRSKEIKKLIDL